MREVREAGHSSDGFLVDDGSDRRRRVFCFPHEPGFRRLREAVDECVVRASDDDDPTARGALLSGITERGRENARDGFVVIRVVIDDDGVLAAHFGDHALDSDYSGGRFCRPRRDELPDGARASERDGRDVSACSTRRAPTVSPAPGKKVDRVFWNACLTKDPKHLVGTRRRLLGGLQDHRVSRDQRRRRHARQDRDRKVPRRDDRRGASRT